MAEQFGSGAPLSKMENTEGRPLMLDFIKGDPAKKLKRELDAARGRRDKQAARLTATEIQLAEARGESIKLAREGASDTALDAAEAKVRAAELRISNLRAAISEEGDHVAEIERQLFDLADSAQRAETADRCDAFSVEMEKFDEKLQVLDDLAKLADLVTPIVTDAAAIGHFARRAHAELVPALQLLSSLLNSHARAVRSGVAPATLPTPEAPPAPPPPAPVLTRVWLTKAIKFSKDGMVERRDSNCWVDLDPVQAAKAVNDSVAVPLGHERAGKILQTFKQYHGYGLPSFDNCHPLDDIAKAVLENKPQPDEVQSELVHSAFQQIPPGFERVDRGPGYTGTIKTHGPDVAA